MASDDEGVPLASYRQHAGIGVLLICTKCCRSDVLDLEAVIRRLRGRRYGDERTGVRAVSRFVRRRCGCGAQSWETRPYFPPGGGREARRDQAVTD